MCLYKRKDSPYWWIKLPPMANESKPLQISTKTTNKREAEIYLNKLKVQRWEQERLGIKPRRTWDEAAQKFLEETSYKRSHADDVSIIRWLSHELGGKGLDQIDRATIDHIKTKRAKIASTSRANRYLTLVRTILRKACYDWEWIDRVPKVTLYKEEEGRCRSLSSEEFWRLHSELPPYLADMALFAVSTGLRSANVRLLEWSWVDMRNCHVSIPAKQFKNGSAHGVPLNKTAMGVLLKRKGMHPKYVFTLNGKPFSEIPAVSWHSALRRAGIEDFRWHDLRHTWATWQRQAGTPTYELQRLGGWKTVSMVDRYAHIAPEGLQAAAFRLDNILSYGQGTPEAIPKESTM